MKTKTKTKTTARSAAVNAVIGEPAGDLSLLEQVSATRERRRRQRRRRASRFLPDAFSCFATTADMFQGALLFLSYYGDDARPDGIGEWRMGLTLKTPVSGKM